MDTLTLDRGFAVPDGVSPWLSDNLLDWFRTGLPVLDALEQQGETLGEDDFDWPAFNARGRELAQHLSEQLGHPVEYARCWPDLWHVSNCVEGAILYESDEAARAILDELSTTDRRLTLRILRDEIPALFDVGWCIEDFLAGEPRGSD